MTTCKNIITECERLGVKPPSGLRRDELVDFRANLNFALANGLSLETSSDYKMPMKDYKMRLKPKYCQVEGEEGWLDHLIDYGWTTITVPGLDVEKAKDGFWSTLENCRYANSGQKTKFRRDQEQTWGEIPPNLHGIFKNTFGHFDWQWEIREKCAKIFAAICETDDLLCSFDGACFIAPGKTMAGSWFHCDQGRFNYNLCCVQGVVALSEAGPDDGGLCVIEGSHKIFADYLDTHPLAGFAWGKIDTSDPLVRDLPMVKVCAKPGEIMLFDSRTFHCNIPPEKGSKEVRMVTYVSMLAKAGASTTELKKRQEWFTKLRMTGHWTKGPWMAMNPEHPRTYGKDYLVPEEKIPVLNERQQALIA